MININNVYGNGGQPPGYVNNAGMSLQPSVDWLIQRQQQMDGQMYQIDQALKQTIKKVNKDRRRRIDSKLLIDDSGRFIYYETFDDHSNHSSILIPDMTAKPVVYRITIADKYEFFTVRLGIITITGNMSELKKNTFFNLWVLSGIQFNPNIPDSEIASVLYKHFGFEITKTKNTIAYSGYAGWEGQKYLTADSVDFLQPYFTKLNIPVLKKYLLRVEFPDIACFSEYAQFLAGINDARNRLIFMLLPCAGILYSIFKEKGRMIPYLFNFIWVTTKVLPKYLADYLQVLNREKETAIYSLESNEKNIDRGLDETKDEVLIFSGFVDENQTYHMKEKVMKNLRRVAHTAMEIQGNVYGSSGMKALVVLVSNKKLLINGVKNVFVDDQFFNPDKINMTGYRSVKTIFYMFIWYVENNYEQIENMISETVECNSVEEAYWKCMIVIMERFCKGVGTTLQEMVGISNDFNYDFLWSEDTTDIEDGVSVVIDMVKKYMSNIRTTERRKACGGEMFVYDESHIWILPQLFNTILEDNKLLYMKNDLLLQCKEAGVLKTNTHDTYSTRLQLTDERKEYYCFNRDAFNHEGELELIAMAKECE